MMKKPKSPSNVRKKKPASDNRGPVKNQYLQLGTWKMIATPKSYEALANDLFKWPEENPDALCVEEFFIDKKMPLGLFYVWKKESELIAEAYEFVKMCLGARREKGALKRQLDSGVVVASMPTYSAAWRELGEWRASLKQRNEEDKNASAKIIVNMQRFPESPMVPEKKEDKRDNQSSNDG